MNKIIRAAAGVLLMAAMLFISVQSPNKTEAVVPALNSAATVTDVKNTLIIRENTTISEIGRDALPI